MQRAAEWCAVVAAVFAAGAAWAAPQPILTSHVPDAVRTHAASLVGAPAADQVMELAISLPLHDQAGLQALLQRIYDPSSPAYRHYLSVADFTARFCPSAAAYQAASAFADGHHLRLRQPAANRRVLDVSGTVADVEQAFTLRIGLYHDPVGNRIFYAPDREPTADVATPVLHVSGLDDAVLPFTHLVRGQPSGAGPAATGHGGPTGSGPQGNFIGSDIRAAYYGGTALTGAGQSVGLLEYEGYELSDISNYFAQVGQTLTVPIVGVSLNGAKLTCTHKCDDAEQVLDAEEAISMAPGLKQLVMYVGHTDVSMLNQMAIDDTSKQLSSSWGWKKDPETVDPIFLEFAAQGQSFVDATGDDGYHLLADAVWPGDDQYVTGVGGTDLVTDGPGGAWQRETGWAYSGGGKSPDGILIPDYQLPIVNGQNGASGKKRNVPDIAGDANTDNYSCYDGGCYTGNGGTSYAAPLMAGFLALANEQAASQGVAPLGFLNPTVYAIGLNNRKVPVFHDQLRGFNGKYTAIKGFDLVTGFGSAAGQALIDALVAGQ